MPAGNKPAEPTCAVNHRWTTLISIVLALFAGFVGVMQLFVININGDTNGNASVISYGVLQQKLTAATNLWEAEGIVLPFAGTCRYLDLRLPPDMRIFVPDMTGKTNFSKGGDYFFLTYYLFPRDIAVSLDQPARVTKDGFGGRAPLSDADLLTNGFDLVVSLANNSVTTQSLRNVPPRTVSNPDWFLSRSDRVIAFLLPLLTALTGMGILRWVLPPLYPAMPLLEKLACGFGLGMMAVAALTLGIKLCGFHGPDVVLVITALGAIASLWYDHRTFRFGLAAGLRKAFTNPLVLIGGFLFLLIFRLAGLEGLAEYDAVAGWALKAKLIHLYAGNELVGWFSNPRLAHAHLDYPTLVPSLYAAGYDSIGHVNEFTIKFWPAWMLLLLVGAVASLNRDRPEGGIPDPAFFILALLLLPVIWRYVLREGATMPMIFFTSLGFLQCAIGQVEKDRRRLALGLILLFGAAMTKFEGFIILAMATGWLLLLPSARPSLKPSPLLWHILVFCIVSALPFACLRVQIPALHYESGWAGYMLQHPGFTLANTPGIFMILLSRWFLNPFFASWSGENGQLHWNGQWEGLSSLYNHSTLGLSWVCLLMTVALWFAVPSRRKIVLWMVAVILGTMAAFSGVFAGIGSITSLNNIIDYTSEQTSGRYLLPLLVAWAMTTVTLFFANRPAPTAPSGLPAADIARPGPVVPEKARRRPKASR